MIGLPCLKVFTMTYICISYSVIFAKDFINNYIIH